MNRRSSVALVALICVAAIAWFSLRTWRSPTTIAADDMVEFNLPSVRDAGRSLTSRQLTGQASVLNVWASWCIPCRLELPLLQRLATVTTAPIYGLNFRDQRNDAVTWLDYYGDPFVVSGWDVDGQVGTQWGVEAVPDTFVLDRQGNIRYRHTGPLTEQTLQQDILPLLQRLTAEG